MIYVTLRLGVNLSLGASPATALRSAVFGLLFFAIALLAIDLIHWYRLGAFRDESTIGTRWRNSNWKALLALSIVWVFWLVKIIHRLQSAGRIPGRPLLEVVPGWAYINGLFARLAEGFTGILPFWSAAVFYNILTGLVFFVALPILILRSLGYRWKDFGISTRGWQLAAPFLALYLAGFAAGSLTGEGVAFLGYALLYPGLVEEFFYRGLLQRALRGWLRPANAILLASVWFGLLHFPDFYFRVYAGSLGLSVLNIAGVTLFGLFMGYGFLRSGGVLPWAAVHALSDVVGL